MHQNAVHQCRMIGLAAAAAVLVFSASTTLRAQADQPPDFVYQLSYYSNANFIAVPPALPAPDATLRLVNDGAQGSSSPGGDLCASIYVFDNNEELAECCSCLITPNGLRTLSVNANLTATPFTSVPLTRGVVKVISAAPVSAGVCSAATVEGEPPTVPLVTRAGIHGWLTHIQHPGNGNSFAQTEEELSPAFLSPAESKDLGEDCAFISAAGAACSCLDARR